MVSIINCGLGNVKAFATILKNLNVEHNIASAPSELSEASKLILPGVGAFDHSMDKLNQSGMREVLDKMVLEDKVPVVGICVGMQMMAKRSDEGTSEGLGWVDAEVKKFDVSKIQFKTHLPHMGWNDINATKQLPILKGLEENAKFYFLHSYYFQCNDDSNIIATAEYGIDFTCAVNRENIYGVQFHPEKSHQYGIQLLKNFSEL